MLDPIVIAEAGKVTLSYPTMPDFNLQMNFNPIIELFRLRGEFCLLHWQAKPYGERRWGVYDGGADNYVSLKYYELELQGTPRLLQVDEYLIKSVPTAVLLFLNSKLVKNGYYSISTI